MTFDAIDHFVFQAAVVAFNVIVLFGVVVRLGISMYRWCRRAWLEPDEEIEA